jgi:putative peptide zinc metalloprotease protein
MESKRNKVLLTDRVQAQIIEAETAYHRNRLHDLQTRQDALLIRSPLAGRFEVASTLDFVGAYVARGDVVGYVLDPSRYTLLTVVPQADVDQVRRHNIGVEIRSAVEVGGLIPATMVREVPGATRDLPSLALSLQGGGKIGLDPDASQEAPVALNALFQFELRFDNRAVPRTLGNRVYVRFIQQPEPLASQWYRALRQMFLKRFAV